MSNEEFISINKVAENLYGISRDFFATLFDVANAASRLEDYMKKNKTVIDLFCGCGGLSLGLEQAGFKIAFASDIDSNCASTYQKNFNIKPNQMYVGDIRDLNKNNDLLTGFLYET